ncbi:BrnA antitoxin family protein [Faunimonas sp. B44]|uniref:BrnA antitoxin family protein n=1 Tax=Faunimonas sp. B44 TaxID=3461493 RepID=UPI004044E93B
MRPACEVLPADLAGILPARRPGQRGPQQSKPLKQRVQIRVDPRIVDAFKATGPRWQTRMNDVLSVVVEMDAIDDPEVLSAALKNAKRGRRA